MTEKQRCLFCRISSGEEKSTVILQDEDGVIIFKDIRPAATHHYLVVPKLHVNDAKHLTVQDVPLVEKLVTVGKEFLEKQGGDIGDARLGFHWPPFHTIAHLHLHVISPQSQMGWIARGIFMPGTWWFKTPEWVLQRLKEETQL